MTVLKTIFPKMSRVAVNPMQPGSDPHPFPRGVGFVIETKPAEDPQFEGELEYIVAMDQPYVQQTKDGPLRHLTLTCHTEDLEHFPWVDGEENDLWAMLRLFSSVPKTPDDPMLLATVLMFWASACLDGGQLAYVQNESSKMLTKMGYEVPES